jgi:hypothetical protein
VEKQEKFIWMKNGLENRSSNSENAQKGKELQFGRYGLKNQHAPMKFNKTN